MSQRWYEHHLESAWFAEHRLLNLREAIVRLDKAKRHTDNPEELRHLLIWRSRLERELKERARTDT